MALVSNTVDRAVMTPTVAAAPTTSETITNPGNGVYLEVVIGGTATTITLTRYAVNPAGDTAANYSSGSLTNTTRMIPVGSEFNNPATSLATVGFSQVTAVTARVWRFAGH